MSDYTSHKREADTLYVELFELLGEIPRDKQRPEDAHMHEMLTGVPAVMDAVMERRKRRADSD